MAKPERAKKKTYTLKACPFCGGAPAVYGAGRGMLIECSSPKCFVAVSVTDSNRNAAAKTWNYRFTPSENLFTVSDEEITKDQLL